MYGVVLDKLPRLTVIELHGYKGWTEILGYDREWLIQLRQSELYSLIQKLFSRNQGFVFPLRYDYYIALSNGIDKKVHEEIFTALLKSSPVPIRMVSVSNPYPLSAQLIATRILAYSTKNFHYIEGGEDPLTILHIDVNNVIKTTYDTSIYEAYVEIIGFFNEIASIATRYGGISGYLGGDNIMVVIPLENMMKFVEIIPDYVKVGIGVSYTPRKSIELATKALDKIRTSRNKKMVIYVEPSLDQELKPLLQAMG